jgi:hypothetical protein
MREDAVDPIFSQNEKLKYSIVDLPDTPWKYSYSAKALQAELNALFAKQTLRSIYVGLDGYLESMHSETNFIDLSYMGGTSLVVFEKVVFQLDIAVEGMIEYRCFPIWEMKYHEVFDYPPNDMVLSDKYFFNAANHEITCDYANKSINDIVVIGTDTWGFLQPTFDEAAAAAAAKENDLPGEIALRTDDCVIRFVGDSIEYYYMIFEGT